MNDFTRCYLHTEVFCFGCGLYFSSREWQPLEVPASGGAQQYVTFAASIDHYMLFSFAHLEQIRNAKNSSLKESASSMTSSPYRRTGVLSMLSTEAHS